MIAKSSSSSFEVRLERMGGQLFVFPLIPAMITFVFSVVASVLLNVSSTAGCSDFLLTYITGIVILGYLLSLYYGYVLVGRKFKSLTNMVIGYAIWVFVMSVWNIVGTVAVSNSNSVCQQRSVYKMSVGLLVIFYLCLVAAFVPPILELVKYWVRKRQLKGDAPGDANVVQLSPRTDRDEHKPDEEPHPNPGEEASRAIGDVKTGTH